ncbi:MAG TPA: hypothetical protein VJ809_04335 [Pirellulales bacterium]|nr:hypothetical protein [Pirellulales bacterium]
MSTINAPWIGAQCGMDTTLNYALAIVAIAGVIAVLIAVAVW